MIRRNPDLIVPIRDRRQHRRYLTLRNLFIAVVVGMVAFIGISIYSEVRGPDANEYGRLVGRRLPPPPAPQKVDVVEEATPLIDDQASADPMLVAPMSRDRWLEGDTTRASVLDSTPLAAPSSARGGDLAIVGGPEGVKIVQKTRRRPQLSGGFGR